ncbi:iron complex transport system ATP-binding protein [Enterococcus sp. PF1-24]|uniref:ABC transporter ATP-binding protein n=1 Tax=unclassified Enterococcus TaxID=2608891 RepID=UPI0024755FA1|nr:MULTISPECIES: ABC transporter ATP-binding protein [unclassified Enterococcus]MDH6364907.1 iron complex transport system ATP-binding protein [Enterococcus sp. PFB1-1]MDH6402008.1 iron complex transport system ATP-binding protein [Enterococcus sp. PF1-24]
MRASYQIKDLIVELNHKTILKKLNLTLEKDCFIGIIGPNGSGKTTFLKCLYKEIKGYQGNVHFFEKDLKNWKAREIAKHNAVVTQISEVSFDFNVLDIVLMGREPYKEWWQGNVKADIEIALKNLQAVGLSAYKDVAFAQLSGGEKQRVLLARALTQEAECLILDEPTNHLDVKNQIDFLNLVKNLKLTVIAVIHDLNLAANYCDQLYLLKDGLIQAAGAPKEILTAELIQEVFEVECKVYQLENQLQIVYRMKM